MRILMLAAMAAVAVPMFAPAQAEARSWRDRHEDRRDYHRDVREARRDYYRDLRRADSRRDVREARRDYRHDLRDARRDYYRDRRDDRYGYWDRGYRGW